MPKGDDKRDAVDEKYIPHDVHIAVLLKDLRGYGYLVEYYWLSFLVDCLTAEGSDVEDVDGVSIVKVRNGHGAILYYVTTYHVFKKTGEGEIDQVVGCPGVLRVADQTGSESLGVGVTGMDHGDG